MDREASSRRRFLRLATTAGTASLAGCSLITGEGSNDIEDTDGDGVIDSEDYAPRDASVQRADQVREVESTTGAEPSTESTDVDESTETTATAESTETTEATTSIRTTVVDDFEAGTLDRVWQRFEDGSNPTGRGAFRVQSSVSPQGSYALRGLHERYDRYSTIRRDDFKIDRDHSNLRLFVKLGPVLSGSERANRVYIDGPEGAVIILDQKNRPGETGRARIGNGNSRNSVLDSVTLVEFNDIRFSDDEIGEVVVGGTTIATDVGFLNDASEISAIRLYQGHFGQPADMIVDGIYFDTPSG